jgi:hypothetical protein
MDVNGVEVSFLMTSLDADGKQGKEVPGEVLKKLRGQVSAGEAKWRTISSISDRKDWYEFKVARFFPHIAGR